MQYPPANQDVSSPSVDRPPRVARLPRATLVPTDCPSSADDSLRRSVRSRMAVFASTEGGIPHGDVVLSAATA